MFFEVLDLGFGKCRFVLAGPADGDFYEKLSHKVVASKYPNVTKDFFNSRSMDVEVVKIEGSVELAPLLGLADAIVDIVETGSRSRNGLEYIGNSACFGEAYSNLASIKMKRTKPTIYRTYSEGNKKQC